MSKIKTVVFVLLLGCGCYALAAPAPWYKWESIQDGDVICAQAWPGEGWQQGAGRFNSYSGPFKDAHCTVRGEPSN
ncbi:MAG: hypothetical protein K8Q92_06050 [Methylophilales bacterium]|nr:hypothetical protein [Methylophilales bacterium]